MSQRTFLLTGTATDFGGNPIANAPCLFQPIVPGNTEAIDGNGKFVQTKPVTFTTDGTGAFSQTIDYPGDFQSAYVNTQVRVTVNGVVTDSPIGFSYASSIALTSWIIAPVTTGLVTMRAVYTKDDNTGIGGVLGSVTLSSPATVVATGQLLSSVIPVQALSAGDGTMLFSLNPNSLLNPTGLVYTLSIDGEFATWSFPCPAIVDVYRGAWNSVTAYTAASGSSNGDVVLNAGVLYRCILANTNQAPPNATYWQVVSGLPTDLISAHLTLASAPGSVLIGPANIAHGSDVPPLAGDPEPSPATLNDDLENLVYRDTQRLRYLGAWGGGTAYLTNDVALSGGTDYICILAHTNHTPPNATYWVAIGGGGGGGFSNPMTTEGDVITGGTAGAAQRLAVGNQHYRLTSIGTDPAYISPPGPYGAPLPLKAEGDVLYRKLATTTTATIGFIGESITAGTVGGGGSGGAPCVTCATALSIGGLTVTANNEGVTSTSSADWQPGSTNLTNAKAAFLSAGVRIVHIMLGTNDQLPGVLSSAATYYANMLAICNDMVSSGYLVVLAFNPALYQPGVLNGYPSDANTHYLTYQQQLVKLANGQTIFVGDTLAFEYFNLHGATELQNSGSPGTNGVHPTTTGNVSLGGLWADALRPLVQALYGHTALAALPIGANGQVLTVAAGSVAWQNNPAGFTNPMTTQDDLILGGALGAAARLAKGAGGQVLTVNSGTGHVDWESPAGGFADPTTTKGDLIVHGASTTRIGVGTDGQVLTANSGVAAGVDWESPNARVPMVTGDTPGPVFIVTGDGQCVMS